MFLLLSSNALQGLTHVNKAVYVCGRFLFTNDSLFVHMGEPLTTTKQRYINNEANANEMRVFIR